jgi:hypothetical protein
MSRLTPHRISPGTALAVSRPVCREDTDARLLQLPYPQCQHPPPLHRNSRFIREEAIPCISHKTGKFTDCSTQFLHRTKIAYYLLLKESDEKFFSPAQNDKSIGL